MPRFVPPAIQEKLDDGVTTLCLLIRIDPVTPGYSSYGAAMLDRDVPYDDGEGLIQYSAVIGFQPTSIAYSSNLSVDNAEATGLMPEFDFPISEADINAGVYDFSEYVMYLVDYLDTDAGHVVLASGTIGRIRTIQDGLSFVEELRGLTDQLKQSITEKDSLSCRAIFGSQPIGSGAEVEQRFPCGFDATTLLEAGTVESVGLESNRTFTDSGLSFAAGDLEPGMMKWLTGANAGRSYEIETNDDGGVISLAHPTAFPIQAGDTFQCRPDCNKVARDTSKGCAASIRWGTEWPLHFRGEPDIPIGDAGANETPGATTSPGDGGSTTIPFEPAA